MSCKYNIISGSTKQYRAVLVLIYGVPSVSKILTNAILVYHPLIYIYTTLIYLNIYLIYLYMGQIYKC